MLVGLCRVAELHEKPRCDHVCPPQSSLAMNQKPLAMEQALMEHLL
jgi:hypothetical protein